MCWKKVSIKHADSTELPEFTSARVNLLQMTEPGYLLHTGTSAHNLRQIGGRDAPKAAALLPLFHGICSRDCGAEQQKQRCNSQRTSCGVRN